MEFETPLISAIFLRRYKRFFVDAQLPDGQTVTAHCPNTGSMKGLTVEGAPCWLSPATNPNRKLRYTLEMIEAEGTPVGVNTGRPNTLVANWIQAGHIAPLTGYKNLKREVPYGENSRADMVLSAPHKPDCYVEVKNVTLKEGSAASFPDAVTTRGLKHLNELESMVRAGHRAVMVFLVQRADCAHFTPADHIDPTYGAALRRVAGNGVEIVCQACTLGSDGIFPDKPLEIRL